MKKIFGFIGCGNMGGALATAVSKQIDTSDLFLFDICKEKVEGLAIVTGGTVTTMETLVEKCDYIFLGVKPQTLKDLFQTLREYLEKKKKKTVFVSMAAAVSIEKIGKYADGEHAIIRIMPNTPSSVGEGMILYDCNELTTKEDIADFCQAMSKAGKLDRIPEKLIDAASALSGCGPAFVYMFAEALADGAVACGLPRDKANLYAAQTLLGSAKMLLESGKHAGELKDAVCSPGGTTIAGVQALENGAFRSSAMNAVIEAYNKTLKLK